MHFGGRVHRPSELALWLGEGGIRDYLLNITNSCVCLIGPNATIVFMI